MMKKAIVTFQGVYVKHVIGKTKIPPGGYAANPYIGCSHGCRYCYACFMKRFTHHPEPWGTFIDVKHWKPQPWKKVSKFNHQRITIGTATDPYLPEEKLFKRTQTLLKEIHDLESDILIITKSDLILRDFDLIMSMKGNVRVAVSINTLDEEFRVDMDRASPIKNRLNVLKTFHDAGLTTICFLAPIFPGISHTDKIIEEVKNYVDFIWLDDIHMRAPYKYDIMLYVMEHYPHLLPSYELLERYGEKSGLMQEITDIIKVVQKLDLPYYDSDVDLWDPELLSQVRPGKPVVVSFIEPQGDSHIEYKRRKVYEKEEGGKAQ